MKILLKNINIVDSKNGERYNKSIHIEDGIIKKIYDNYISSSDIFDNSYDMTDKWVMPGLIDMHVHLCAETGLKRTGNPATFWRMSTSPALKVLHAQNNAYKSLLSGFTTLRNCGHVSYYSPEDIALREAVKKEIIVCPKIVACGGSLTMTAGHGDLTFNSNLRRLPDYGYGDKCFDGPENCLTGVREKIRIGADFIKIMASGGMGSSGDQPEWPNFNINEIKTIVNEAHDLNKKVAAHAQGIISLSRCIEAGVDTIEHGCALTRELCFKMAEKGLFYIPTLRVVKILINSSDIEEREKAKKLISMHAEAIRYAKEEGVKIGYGTDTINALKHGENALEIIDLLEAGLSSQEVFNSLTSISAQAIGDNCIGNIDIDMKADLIILNENPIVNIKLLTNPNEIKYIFLDGKLIKQIL